MDEDSSFQTYIDPNGIFVLVSIRYELVWQNWIARAPNWTAQAGMANNKFEFCK